MRILIDVLHPAHVHFFRHFYAEMEARGHTLLVTARAKEQSLELLERYAIPYRLLSRQRTGALGLAAELAARTWRLARVIGASRPDVLTGIMGPSIALAGAVRRVPAVVFYDTEFATQTNWFTYPLAHSVCTPRAYQGKVRGRHHAYAGYHELAYLHPRRFAPDPRRLAAFGVQSGESYSLVRFVSWGATHDRRERGLSVERKRTLVAALERHGRVLISSEGPLPSNLENRRVQGPAEEIHHLIAHARMVAGESATMSSEAAVLGVPAVFIATTGRGYTDEQEQRYGLVRHVTDGQFADALRIIEDWLTDPSAAERAARGRRRLLEETIDVTAWMVDFFEREFGAGA